MNGRSFLDIARELVLGVTSWPWRTAPGRAYYALFLEVRAAMQRWGFVPLKSENAHAYFRLRLVDATDPDAKNAGLHLERLLDRRLKADYDLRSPLFGTDAVAQHCITRAEAALALLDAID